MRSHSYEVQKGNEVKPQFVGKTVTWQKAQTIGEALGLPTDVGAQISALCASVANGKGVHFMGEAAIVAAAEQQRDIAVREDIRSILSKDEGTIDAAATAAQELVIGAPREGGKVGKAKKPETLQARAAASVGNKIFEKALVDEKFRAQMAKNDMLEGFEEWQAARQAAQDAKAPAAPTV